MEEVDSEITVHVKCSEAMQFMHGDTDTDSDGVLVVEEEAFFMCGACQGSYH